MYKTIFEFRIFHQYYLAGKDGRSVLDTSDIESGQHERWKALQEKFNARIPSITDQLTFSFAEPYKHDYKKYDIRLQTTYSGFRVLVPVKEFPQADGTFWYKPVRSIPAGLPFVIEISRRGPIIDTITNGRLAYNLPSNYFFTNLDPGGSKRFPVVSEVISPRDPDYLYEQGELYSSGNSVFAIFYDKDGTENQFPVAGTAFVNENDRIAISPRFTYTFRDSDRIVDYSFVLKSPSGQTLQTVSHTAKSPVKNVALDFSRYISATASDNLKPHQLEVRGTGDYRRVHTVSFIDPEDTGNSAWGWISIHQQSGPSDFNLFDSSGFLALRLDNNRSEINLPVFEIWLKSRFSFWRYKNNKGKSIKQKTDLDLFFDYEEGRYISKTLRHATYVPTEFKAAGPGFRFFPNPVSYDSVVRETKRVYTDILVPHSTTFET